MKIICGDSKDELKKIPENSVDSICCDPPYGLSFMGKKWDYDVPSVEIWKECLRVLKPGGYLLSFAGTRTQHRMAVNIEDAGFEIRDMIAWVYGSGFPKSHNIGKAVDKKLGNEREVVGKKKGQGNIPNDRGNWGLKPNESVIVDKGNSPYEGWGTALKPAMEPITVARKPFKGTVADNVLKWGTGGINIDECRVKYDSKNENFGKEVRDYGEKAGGQWQKGKQERSVPSTKGRFPANFIHDGSEEVVGLFPESKSQGHWSKTKTTGFGKFGNGNSEYMGIGEKDKKGGNASRFFYCAKASKKDRNEGLEGFEEKDKEGKNFRPNHTEKAEQGEDGNPFGRWGKIKNNHPTVKPTKLMQYLVRLVTPKGGTVLDPFMGSGSTGKACKLEGFDFIGIDLNEDYCKIAEARINNTKIDNTLFAKEPEKKPKEE